MGYVWRGQDHVVAVSLLTTTALTQQNANPQPSAQAQSVPCSTTSTAPSPSGNNAAYKIPGKWKQLLDKQRQKVETATGISVPDPSTDIEQALNSKPATPCPAQATPPKNLPTALLTVAKLPPDVSTTLHCSPITPSTSGATGHPTTLTLPDPHDFATPKPTDFEVDTVVPDLAAKTGCWSVKIDPKTGKSFVAQ
jgi:hypothetical protein